MVKFTASAVRKHIRKHHPGCPEFAVDFFAAEVSGKEWQNVGIGKAVGIAMDSLLRHHMTDYDMLMMSGVDRDDARKRVQPRIEAMLALWKKPPVAE